MVLLTRYTWRWLDLMIAPFKQADVCSETLQDAFSWATSISRTRISTVDGLSLAASPSSSTISDLQNVLRTMQTLHLKKIPYEELQENDFVGEGETFSVIKHRYQNNIVAVRFIKRKIVNGAIDRSALRRRLQAIFREIQILQHGPIKSHPNLICLIGYGWQLEDGRPYPYIVVEYGSLGSMRPFLKSNSKLPLRDKVMLAGDIAAGLTALHDTDIIHGDLKLENVVLFHTLDRPSGYLAKLCDFGHSVILTSEEHQLWYYGTPLYLPPEAFRQEIQPIRREDLHKCDIWAFGLALWEILSNGEIFLQHKWFSSNENSFAPISSIPSIPRTSEKDRPKETKTKLGATSQTIPEYTKYFGNFDLTRLQHLSQEAVERACPTKTFQHSYLGPLLKQTLHPEPDRRVSRLSRFPIMTERKLRTLSDSLEAKLAIHTHTDDMEYDIFRPEKQGDIHWVHQVEIFNDISNVASVACPGPKLASVCFQLMICYMIGFGCEINYFLASQNLRHAVQNGMRIAQIFQDNLASVLTEQPSSEAHTTFASKLRSGVSGQRNIETATLYLMSFDKLGRASEISQRHCVDVSSFALSSDLLAAAQEMLQMSLKDVLIKTCLFTRPQQPIISWLEYAILTDDKAVFNHYCKVATPIDLSTVGAFGEAPIICACRLGRTEMVRGLLTRGANATLLLYWLFCLEDAAVDCLELALHHDHKLLTLIDRIYPEKVVVDPQWPTELSGTPLAFAVVTDSRDLVSKLLSVGANLLDPALPPNDDGSASEWTAIHIAVKYNHVEILKDMLNYLNRRDVAWQSLQFPRLQLPSALSFLTPVERFGIHGQSATQRLHITLAMLPFESLSWRSSKGVTPLLQAIDFENFATVEALLAIRSRLARTVITNPTDSSSLMLPLHFAAQVCARRGSTDAQLIPRAILKAYPKGLFTPDGTGLIPLHLAAAANFAEVTRLLISEGSPVNSRDELGRSPLMLCRSGANSVELLQNGADIKLVDDQGLNTAHHAILRGDETQMQLLIRSGVSIEHLDQRLSTPLHYAVECSSRTQIELLLNAGAPINVPNVNGDTALHVAVQAGRNDVIRLLVQHEADLSIRNNEKSTPLLLAIKRSSAASDTMSAAITQIFRSLLETLLHGNFVSNNLTEILHALAGEKGEELMTIFLDNTAGMVDVNSMWTGRCALHVAAEFAWVGVGKALLSAGADPNALDSSLSTPLITLCASHRILGDRIAFADALRGRSADLTASDQHGLTPWSIAHQKHDFAMMTFLLRELPSFGEENDPVTKSMVKQAFLNGHVDFVHACLRYPTTCLGLMFQSRYLLRISRDLERYFARYKADAVGVDFGYRASFLRDEVKAQLLDRSRLFLTREPVTANLAEIEILVNRLHTLLSHSPFDAMQIIDGSTGFNRA